MINQNILGLGVFLFLGWLLSENKKKISWKLVLSAISLQILLALVLFKFPLIKSVFFFINEFVLLIDKATKNGSQFMFGYLSGGPLPFSEVKPGGSFIVAFQVLPIVLVMSAISSLLFYWGILQKIIYAFSFCLEKVFKISGLMGFSLASNIFFGIIEAPILMKPYLNKMNRSELFLLMTAGMATVAGTVMVLYSSILQNAIPDAAGHILLASIISAPAALLISQMIIPLDASDYTPTEIDIKSDAKNSAEALIIGTMEGLQMVLHIVAIIIVLFSLVFIVNHFLGWFPFEAPLSLELIMGYIFRPFCWLMGIPWEESLVAGELMGTKTILNEFVAYMKLPTSNLSDSSKMILLYSMCGFANFGSLGIIAGGLGAIMPDRRDEVLSLGFKSIFSGTIATMMTGTIISFLV